MSLMPARATRLELTLCWVSNYRYLLLVLFLLLQVLAFSLQGLWVEDFWEHSAAVSEFMQHPLNPSHPQLNVNAPHTFLNPYTLVVALSASAFGLTSITALSIFGAFNFCLFCIGLYAFVSTLCHNKNNATTVSFYALLFVLFLWGGQPWPYSGFFSYQIFFFNLPYPSTFIGGLSLLTLGLHGQYQTIHPALRWLAVTVVVSLCLLTHPLTAQFLVLGLIAQALFAQSHRIVRLLAIAVACVVAVALASSWPFYPFIELLRGAASVYDLSNGTMYYHFIERIWPFIVLSPLIVWAMFQREQRIVLFIFVSTIVIYLFGYYTHKYSYGRIISYTILMAQVCCAVVAARAEDFLYKLHARALPAYQALVIFLLLAVSFNALSAATSRLLTAANSVRLERPIFNQVLYKDFVVLPSYIPTGSIVFANLGVSWLLPSFGVKVIAAEHPLAFVRDAAQRQQDLEIFFTEGTAATIRLELLKKYDVDYLLIDKTLDRGWQTIALQISEATRASALFEDSRFVLLSTKQSN
jgi:hypothetical protein